MHHPIISVIIPVFNREKTISRALQSLQKQTYPHWEAIVIDDGSTDNSLSIIHEFSRKDKRIYPLSSKNKGIALARNTALQFARGKWITFLDSDDEYLPEHLSIRIHTAQKHPTEMALYGGAYVIGSNLIHDRNDYNTMIPANEVIVTGTLFLPRSAVDLVDGFRNLPYGEDTDIFDRIRNFYPSHKIASRTYIYHRELPDSFSKSY